MTTLITGGGSQVGSALAQLLHEAGRKAFFASRSGKNIPAELGFPFVKFDWDDPSTFEEPFAHAAETGDVIRYVYILCPGDHDPLPKVKPFIDLAVSKGTVERFVLMSSSGFRTDMGPESATMGRVHTYLHDQGLDYFILRPTWFMENLVRLYGQSIREMNVIETIVPTGRIPFVAVDDIAQVAFDTIVNIERFLPCREPKLIGPELVSYNDIATILTEVLGRKIEHRTSTPEAFVQKYTQWGLAEGLARALVTIELDAEQGEEEKLVHDKTSIVGKVGIREWIEKHKDALSSA